MRVAEQKVITQVCVVVRDVHKVNANWAKVLGIDPAPVEQIFNGGITHYTHGKASDFIDLQVAKYDLGNLVLELMQPGDTPSPWGDFLKKHGQGVFHFCISVGNRKIFQQRLGEIGVGLPYHIGYHPHGSYSYVNSSEQLGVELSINNQSDNGDLMEKLLAGLAEPLDELK